MILGIVRGADYLGFGQHQTQQLHFHDSQINILREIRLETRVLQFRRKERKKSLIQLNTFILEMGKLRPRGS